MFTETEMHDLFERVLGKMLVAGWLSSFTFTKDKGWWRNWTAEGDERRAVLWKISETFDLAVDDRLPLAFYEAAKSGCFLGSPLPEEQRPIAAYFAECVDALSVSGEDEILTMVRIARWE